MKKSKLNIVSVNDIKKEALLDNSSSKDINTKAIFCFILD